MPSTEQLAELNTERVGTTLAVERGEVLSLTGLRLFAAAWVVLFHFQFTLEWTDERFLRRVLGLGHAVVNTGAMGVDLFYVLSGFVIAFTYLGKLGERLRPRAAGRFLWARICRIWPVYVVVTTAFGAFLVYKQFVLGDETPAYQTVQPELSVRSWLTQLAMAQIWPRPWHDGVSWVGPAWSISAEWLAYVLFPLSALLFFRLRRWPRWVLGPVAVALMAPVGVLCLATGSPYFPYSWMVRILTGFTAGVLVYLVVAEIPRTEPVRRVASWLSWVLLAAVFGALALGEALNPGPDGTERGGVVLMLFPLVVGALALADRGPARLLATRWAVHGGRFSYSLYLVHVPLFEVMWSALERLPLFRHHPVLSSVLAVLSLALVLLFAHLLYKLVEEPARRTLRRLTDRRPPAVHFSPSSSPVGQNHDQNPTGDELGGETASAATSRSHAAPRPRAGEGPA